ncbi:GAF domain-containing protein, partial [Candidatus Aerophobetes bacterium]
INRIFFLLAISTSILVFSDGLESQSLVPYITHLFLRIEFAAAALAAYFFLLFCLSFHEVHLVSSSSRRILVFLPAAAFTLLAFSDLIITGTRFYDHGIPFRMGPLFGIYAAYLIIFTGAGCLDLVLKYKESRGIKKMQTLYLLLGFLLTAALAVPLNLFSRSQFLPRASEAGNYGFLFFISFTTYAIFKYRFMDIRVIIRQTTVYLGGLLLVLILGFFLWHPLSSYFSLPPVVNLFLILLSGVIVFQLAHSRIQRIANRGLFSSIHWTQKNVKSLSQRLTTLMDREKLVSVVLRTIMESFRLDKAGILLRKETSKGYRSEKLIGFKAKDLSLARSNFLVRHLTKTRSPEIQEELTLKIKDAFSEEKRAQLAKMKEEMRKIETEVCLPLLSKGRLVGLLLLGKKISGRPYSKQDLELLQTLANQSALALDNARLYQEVKKSLLERTKLHEILISVSSLFDVAKILKLVVKGAIDFTDSQRSVVLVLDKKKKEIHHAAMEASSPEFSYEVKDIKPNDLAWRTIQQKKPLLAKVPQVSLPLTQSHAKAREARAVLSLPLRGQEDVLGVLIASSSSPGSFGKEEVQILSILADEAAIAIEKARLIEDLEKAREELQDSAKKLSQKVKEKTEELKQSQAHLFQSEKLAGIGQLAAGIAHEIRNPLGIMATSLYYLNDVLSEKSKNVKKHFQIIDSEINRCEGIISNLLEFSRKSEKELEVIDVNALLNITLSLVEKDLFVKDIKLTKKLEDSPTIRVNMDEMKQVFLNLILNATQAMPNGGRLEVATSLTENQRARIKIADSGIGIRQRHLSKIFDPFFTTKAPGEGTGLGLTLVHAIIERFGGTVQVESQDGKGTTFIIEFPILKEESSKEKIHASTNQDSHS